MKYNYKNYVSENKIVLSNKKMHSIVFEGT